MVKKYDIEDDQEIENYRNNKNLKKPGQRIEWNDHLLEEYVKCSQDPIYFIESYVKIVHPDDGLVSFKLYDYQKDIVNSLNDNRFTIVATARQAGKCCSSINTIKIRSKKTGEIRVVSIGEFYEYFSRKNMSKSKMPSNI